MGVPAHYLIAVTIAAGVAGWMITGETIEGGRSDARPQTIAERVEKAENKLFKVQAAFFTAQTRKATLEARGSTEASGKVAIRSETTGLLNQRHVKKGDWVKAGDLICTLNVGARQATVQQMRAQLAKAEIDFAGASQLVRDGYATRTRVNSDKAAVDEAKAQLKAAEIELARTEIRAPIDGIVQDPFAKVGDMLQVGDVCANVVEPGTMTMIAQISERYIGDLSLGDEASVRLITGKSVTGAVKYIAPSADVETRTFRVEIDLPNPENRIRDGVTALAQIRLPDEVAHKLPASLLTLDDEGRIGVKTLDAEELVGFAPVKILDDDLDGIWVAGLPAKVKIITRGQEYVVNGQRVDSVVKTAEVR